MIALGNLLQYFDRWRLGFFHLQTAQQPDIIDHPLVAGLGGGNVDGTIVDLERQDAVTFHGAKLEVEVLNRHRSSWRFFRKHDWAIAEDRLVRLEEAGIEVRFDSHLIRLELRKRGRGEMPPYSGFVSELPRKLLKNFPVLLQFDKRRQYVESVIHRAEAMAPAAE